METWTIVHWRKMLWWMRLHILRRLIHASIWWTMVLWWAGVLIEECWIHMWSWLLAVML